MAKIIPEFYFSQQRTKGRCAEFQRTTDGIQTKTNLEHEVGKRYSMLSLGQKAGL